MSVGYGAYGAVEKLSVLVHERWRTGLTQRYPRPRQAWQRTWQAEANSRRLECLQRARSLTLVRGRRNFGEPLTTSTVRALVKGYYAQAGVVTPTKTTHSLVTNLICHKVLFAKYSGTEIKVEGASHLLLESSDILARITD